MLIMVFPSGDLVKVTLLFIFILFYSLEIYIITMYHLNNQRDEKDLSPFIMADNWQW